MKLVSIAALIVAVPLSTAMGAEPIPDTQSPMPNAAPASGPERAEPKEPLTAAAVSPETFVHEVAASDAFEVQAGKLAEQKSGNGQVRAFAAKMVTDHTASTNQLFDVMAAARMEPALPATPDEELTKMLNDLKGHSGTDFDQAYLRTQIAGHEKMAGLLRSYSQSGKNPALRAFATKLLPAVQTHLQKAQQIGQKIHVS